MARGWWNMACWNGLSAEQQDRLITVGNLEIGYKPEGACPRGAEVEVTTMHDVSPGPRFYCAPCAVTYLGRVLLANPRIEDSNIDWGAVARARAGLCFYHHPSASDMLCSLPTGHEGMHRFDRRDDEYAERLRR